MRANISHGWEALRGDPIPWLLVSSQPNLHWRVLTDLVHRPPDSPAVVRARGGANAVEPLATLLAELMPDGSWSEPAGNRERFFGTGRRLMAAVQWGADSTDPRLHAWSQLLMEDSPGSGGFAPGENEEPSAWFTARMLQALAALGWCRHARFQEALAWLDEAAPRSPDGGWSSPDATKNPVDSVVTPVALLDALTTCDATDRRALRDRAIKAVRAGVGSLPEEAFLLGHPNIDRTDAAECLAVLARADAGYDPRLRPALVRLQELQGDGGRWSRDLAVPESLSVDAAREAGEPSRWVTLKAASAILRYGVEAGLPRMYPEKPQ